MRLNKADGRQVRIYRIQRDIPMPLVTSGVEKGNLRELALARMGQLGLKCRDVRTREAGIQDIHNNVRPPPPAWHAHACQLRQNRPLCCLCPHMFVLRSVVRCDAPRLA